MLQRPWRPGCLAGAGRLERRVRAQWGADACVGGAWTAQLPDAWAAGAWPGFSGVQQARIGHFVTLPRPNGVARSAPLAFQWPAHTAAGVAVMRQATFPPRRNVRVRRPPGGRAARTMAKRCVLGSLRKRCAGHARRQGSMTRQPAPESLFMTTEPEADCFQRRRKERAARLWLVGEGSIVMADRSAARSLRMLARGVFDARAFVRAKPQGGRSRSVPALELTFLSAP